MVNNKEGYRTEITQQDLDQMYSGTVLQKVEAVIIEHGKHPCFKLIKDEYTLTMSDLQRVYSEMSQHKYSCEELWNDVIKLYPEL